MGETISLPIDIFTKMIEGQARVEAKLDSYAKQVADCDARITALEQQANEASGAGKMAMWLMSGLSGVIGALISFAFSHWKTMI